MWVPRTEQGKGSNPSEATPKPRQKGAPINRRRGVEGRGETCVPVPLPSSAHPFSRPPSGQDTTPTTARPQPLLSLSVSTTRRYRHPHVQLPTDRGGAPVDREQIARYWDIAS